MKKSTIIDLISDYKIHEAEEAIDEYERKNPEDADLCALKSMLYVTSNNTPQAMYWAAEGVRRLPLNADMQYNYAVACEMIGNWVDSYIAYIRAAYLYEKTGCNTIDHNEAYSNATRLMNNIRDSLVKMESDEISKTLEQITALEAMRVNHYSLEEKRFRSLGCPKMIGEYLFETATNRRFAGYFRDQFFVHFIQYAPMDVMRMKAEFLEVSEGSEYMIPAESNEYIIPIASAVNGNTHEFMNEEERDIIVQEAINTFSFYRVHGNTFIRSSEKSYYGKAIPIRHSSSRKKLVISIFLDGVSESVIRGMDFETNMPYTAGFFKNGTVFTEAYNAAEWTYPSIANYVSGLSTPKHMLYHPSIDYHLPLDTPTLAEYYQQEGYYTSYYGGDWRIIPSYGYARGFDRFVYQHQKVGFKIHDVIADVINQIEAFKEIDQYIWMTIGDLHDIADGDELSSPIQTAMSIEERVVDNRGQTSVKQNHNTNLKKQYIRSLSYIDRWLHILYNYINENYKDEDILISLFSDHGQGYLIERDTAHFLSWERSNVPVFFYGGESIGRGICKEIISSLDYSIIMRKLSKLPLDEDRAEGILPRFFGGSQGRKYALSESIHPGDPYQAAVFTERGKLNYFYQNSDIVQDDGRFGIATEAGFLEDDNGNKVSDSDLEEFYHSIVMEHIAGLLLYED